MMCFFPLPNAGSGATARGLFDGACVRICVGTGTQKEGDEWLQLKVAIIDTVDGIPAIRYRDSEGQHPALNLSPCSKSQGNKRANAILEGRLSPVGFLIRNHARRIAELLQERKAPLANPIRWDSKVTFSDYAHSIIAAQNREIEWLSKQTYVVVDKRRSTHSLAIRR